MLPSIIIFFSNPINAFLTFVVMSMFALAWRTWRSDPKNRINVFFALAAVFASLWLIAVLGYRNAEIPLALTLLVRLNYLAPIGIVFCLYFFSYYFPYRIFLLTKRELSVVFLSTFFMAFIVILPDVFLARHVLPENRFKPEVSLVWHLVFAGYYVLMVAQIFQNFLEKYKPSHGIWRTRLKQVMAALIVALFGSPIFTLFLSILYDHRFEWIAGFFVLFLVVYIWYTIFWKPWRVVKHRK